MTISLGAGRPARGIDDRLWPKGACMADKEYAPDRWELILSGVATLALTVAAVLQEDLTTLAKTTESIGKAATPWWLSAVLSIPAPVYWVITVAAGAGLFWLGLRFARRYGAPVLFAAPAIMLALPYVITWLLFSPIRAVTGAAKF